MTLKNTIIIVEDELLVAQDIKLTLESLGYEIPAIATRGEDALRIVADVQPALVLMDIHLAGEIDGITAAQSIVAKHDIPVVYLTAFADNATLERAKETSPFGYIVKPFNEQTLRITIEIAIQKHLIGKLERESDKKIRDLVKHSSDGILLTDTDGKIIIWNDRMAEITGIALEDALEQPFWKTQVKLSNQPKNLQEQLSKRIETFVLGFLAGTAPPQNKIDEAVIHREDGTKRIVQISLASIHTSQGITIGCITRDITEQKKFEEIIKESEKRHRLLLEQNPAAVVVHRNNTALYVNPACVKMLGARSYKDLVGRRILDFVAKKDQEFIIQTFSPEHIFDYKPVEQTIIRLDGTEIEVLATGARIQYQGKAAIQSVFLDISEKARTKNALLKTQSIYRNLVKNAALGIASCDRDGNILEINTALLAILGSPSEEASRPINMLTFPPLKEAGFPQQIQLCFATGEKLLLEASYTSKWGKTSYLRAHISPSQYDEAKVSSVQVLVEDFTDYQQAVDNLQSSEEKFRKIYEQAGDSIIIIDFEGNIVEANQHACKELMFTKHEFSQMNVREITTFSQKEIDEKLFNIQKTQNLVFEAIRERKDGSALDVEVNSTVILHEGQQRIMLVARNITARKLTEEIAEKHREELRSLIEISRKVSEVSGYEDTLQTILKHAIHYLNASAGSLNITSQNIKPAFVYESLPSTMIAHLKEFCPLHTHRKPQECLMQKEHTYQLTYGDGNFSNCHPANQSEYEVILSSPLFTKQELLGYLHLYRETHKPFTKEEIQFLDTLLQQSTTSIKKAHLYEETQVLATIDVLTQLYNRRHLYTLGKYEIERAQRYKEPLSAFMIDADHFKKINDAHGHAVGDQVLQELTNHLRKGTRDVDVLGRYGGEEFAAILPNTTLEAATELAERLRKGISEEIGLTHINDNLSLTISIGVASMGPDTPTLESLLDKADTALYKAKRAGRKTVIAH